MTYDEAMEELSAQLVETYWAVLAAYDAADNTDGAPVKAMRRVRGRLAALVLDVECLVDHNCTREELADAEALYKGAKQAGLL